MIKKERLFFKRININLKVFCQNYYLRFYSRYKSQSKKILFSRNIISFFYNSISVSSSDFTRGGRHLITVTLAATASKLKGFTQYQRKRVEHLILAPPLPCWLSQGFQSASFLNSSHSHTLLLGQSWSINKAPLGLLVSVPSAPFWVSGNHCVGFSEHSWYYVRLHCPLWQLPVTCDYLHLN